MKRIRISYILIFFAALGQGVLWVNTFLLLHFGVLSYIGGFPVGIAIVGIVTRGANMLPGTQSKRARQVGWYLLALILITETLVLGTSNYTYYPNIIIAYGVSFVITSALIFGAVVERSLIPAEKPVSKSQAKESGRKRTAKKSLKVPCEWCGRPISDSQNAKNAHAPYCTVLQEASKQ